MRSKSLRVSWRKVSSKRKGMVWKFRLNNDPNRTWLSTGGATSKPDAEVYVEEYLKERADPDSLRAFTADFFHWHHCGWLKRERKAGYTMSRPVAESRRRHLVKRIVPRFGAYKLRDIQQGEVADH